VETIKGPDLIPTPFDSYLTVTRLLQEGVFHGRCRLVAHPGQDVTVRVEGGGYGPVTKHLLNHLRVGVLGEESNACSGLLCREREVDDPRHDVRPLLAVFECVAGRDLCVVRWFVRATSEVVAPFHGFRRMATEPAVGGGPRPRGGVARRRRGRGGGRLRHRRPIGASEGQRRARVIQRRARRAEVHIRFRDPSE
jgi:hypothetical protein